MARRRKVWSRDDFLEAINKKGRKKKRQRRPKMSGNKIMEAVMLGHMLGKNNKKCCAKESCTGHHERFPNDWDG